jgi:SAM-dependent methyltransferase
MKKISSYEVIAPEYYDPIRHPTCANFRQASYLILSDWLSTFPIEDSLIYEVGAGKSLLLEILNEFNREPKQTIISDLSPSMLAYSKSLADDKTRFELVAASNLPVEAATVDLVVSSLGDPYNDKKFWEEMQRVLKKGGLVFFTTPSFNWAKAFRPDDEFNKTTAEFELQDSRHVFVPSFIFSKKQQTDLLEETGFHLEDYKQVSLIDIKTTKLSPKLLVEDMNLNQNIVEGYKVTKK